MVMIGTIVAQQKPGYTNTNEKYEPYRVIICKFVNVSLLEGQNCLNDIFWKHDDL